MTRDADGGRSLSSKQIRVLFVVGLILGATGLGLAATFLNNSVEISGPVPVGASNGPSATLRGSGSVNLTDFYDGQTLILNTTGGNLTAYSNGNTEFDVRFSEINGTTTRVTNVSASSDLYIQPEDKRAFNVSGSPDAVTIRQMAVSDGQVDFSYDSTSEFKLTVRTDGTDGTQYGAINDANNQGLAVDIAQNSGKLTFTLPAGDYDVRIQPLGTLYIYNETSVRENGTLTDAELVDNVSVELRFFADELTGSPQIYERSTSSGRINMTGLPADQSFVIIASTDNYNNRRIYVPSLLETQEVFLLPVTSPSVTQRFEMKDFTGRFPPEYTVLEIQRALNGSWRVVEGDFFGATSEFSATMAYNSRHRLVLTNTNTGEEKILGTYIPLTSTTQTINVAPDGTVSLELVDVSFKTKPQAARLPALNGTTVTVGTDPGDESLRNWSVRVEHVNESGATTLLWETNESSAGEVSHTFDLANRTGYLRANFSATTTDGAVATWSTVFAISEAFPGQDMSLLDLVGDLVNLSPSGAQSDFTMFLAVALSLLFMAGVATQFRISGEAAGLIGVLALAFFGIIGFVTFDLVFVAVVGVIAFAGLRRGL